MSDAIEDNPPKRKRRWYQFSLRSLMIFTLICAIPCAWLGDKIERKRKEREAIKQIEALGGRAFYDYELRHSFGAEPAGPAWLRALLGDDFFCDVGSVGLADTHVSDGDLACLKRFPALQMLCIRDTDITDAALLNLSGLSDLFCLDLSDDSRLTGTGLTYIKGLTQLKFLNMANDPNLTDAGIVNLEGMAQLQIVFLNKAKVTDAGLRRFKRLNQLELLDLSETKVSKAGVRDLKKALPNCDIDL